MDTMIGLIRPIHLCSVIQPLLVLSSRHHNFAGREACRHRHHHHCGLNLHPPATSHFRSAIAVVVVRVAVNAFAFLAVIVGATRYPTESSQMRRLRRDLQILIRRENLCHRRGCDARQ